MAERSIKTTQMTFLALATILLIACQGQQGASSNTPEISESPSTITDCTSASGNCATIPEAPPSIDTATPPDTKPTITLPNPETLLATAGNAYNLLVYTKHATSISAECSSPDVTMTPFQGAEGLYTFFVGKMPAKDLNCTITATGPEGTISAPVVIKSQPPSALEKIGFLDIPATVKVVTHTDFVSGPIEITGMSAVAAEPIVVCNINKAAIKKGDAGKYILYIRNELDPLLVDICTIIVQDLSGHSTTYDIVMGSIYPLPFIRPINFKLDAPLILSKDGTFNGLHAYVDAKLTDLPQYVIRTTDGNYFKDFNVFHVTCTGNGFDEINSQPLLLNGVTPTYQMNIHYTAAGSGEEQCTLAIGLTDPENYARPLIKLEFKLKWAQ
ncbi:MAG: hypothetical protein COV45_05735 [Deltaproteobacteria bacterium CG11_big_fil_rev_8_21_14_0_20_47_16]|nr:MAG: hypothetical protein COV45_05735 [Deltaproteobacteria bacterium CG11_big_fil_rev_8_21_14_0_20_47_16]